MGTFLRRSHLFIIIEKKSTKALDKLCLRYFNIGLNMGTNYNAGLKQGFDLEWYYDQNFYPLIFWVYHVEFHERIKMPFTVRIRLH